MHINRAHCTYYVRVRHHLLLLFARHLSPATFTPSIPRNASLHLCTHFTKYLLIIPDTLQILRAPATALLCTSPTSRLCSYHPTTQPATNPSIKQQLSTSICSSSFKSCCNLPHYINLTQKQSSKSNCHHAFCVDRRG